MHGVIASAEGGNAFCQNFYGDWLSFIWVEWLGSLDALDKHGCLETGYGSGGCIENSLEIKMNSTQDCLND